MPRIGAILDLLLDAHLAMLMSSRSVGALLGLVPRKYQSGETDRNGRIPKTGDAEARFALFEAAHVMLHRVKRCSGLKAWATRVAKRQGPSARP